MTVELLSPTMYAAIERAGFYRAALLGVREQLSQMIVGQVTTSLTDIVASIDALDAMAPKYPPSALTGRS